MKNYIRDLNRIELPEFMDKGKKFFIDYQGAIRAAQIQRFELLISKSTTYSNGVTSWSQLCHTFLRIANFKDPVAFYGDPIVMLRKTRIYETLDDVYARKVFVGCRGFNFYRHLDILKEYLRDKAEIYADRDMRSYVWFRHWKFDGTKAVPCPLEIPGEFKFTINCHGEIITSDFDFSKKNGCYITEKECEADNTIKIIDFGDESEEEASLKKDILVLGENISVSDSEIDEIKSFLSKFKK